MVEIPVTGYQILGIIEKAEKDEIVKAAMELKNAEIENGYTAEVSTCRQALLVDVRDKLLFEQEYAGSIKEKVPPRSSLHIPWSWLPAALCVLQEVNVPNCLEAAFSKVPPSSDVFGVIVQDGCAGPRQSYVSKCMRSHSIEKRSTELDAVEEENEMKDENQNKEPLVLTKLSLRKLRAKLKETLIAHEEPLVSTKLSLRKLRAKLKETLIAHEQSQDQDASRESGQYMEAPCEEDGKSQSDVYSGQQGDSGGCKEVMGKIQQQE